MLKGFFTLFLICLLSSCENEGAKGIAPRPVFNLGTFNIQFLSAGYDMGENPRSATDYGNLARLISESELHLLAVQEIESPESLERLEENGLSDSFEAALGTSGGRQRVGVLYDTDAGFSIGEVRELREVEGFTSDYWSNVRYPLMVEVELSETFRFALLSVHLKAGIERDDAQQRGAQVEQLVAWAENQTLPFVIAGDFNDTLEGINDQIDTLAPLEEATETGRFLTAEVEDFSSLQFFDLIDHIFVSPEMDAIYLENSTETIKFDEESSYEGAVISDHRPVRCSFAVPGV